MTVSPEMLFLYYVLGNKKNLLKIIKLCFNMSGEWGVGLFLFHFLFCFVLFFARGGGGGKEVSYISIQNKSKVFWCFGDLDHHECKRNKI